MLHLLYASRDNDIRIIGGPVLCLFLVITFLGMDWVTRVQKALLVLLIAAQCDMFIGSFLDLEWGTCYVQKDTAGEWHIELQMNFAKFEVSPLHDCETLRTFVFSSCEYDDEMMFTILTAGNIKRMTQDQRHAYGYTGWSLDTAKDNLNPDYTPSSIQVQKISLLILRPTLGYRFLIK